MKIRASVVIEQSADFEEHTQVSGVDDIQRMHMINSSEQIVEPIPDTLKESKLPRRKSRKALFWLFMLVSLLGGIELWLFTIEVFNQRDWLGAIWLVLLLIGLLIACKHVISEFRGLKHLKAQTNFKQQAQLMLSGSSIGQGEHFCNSIVAPLENQYADSIVEWKNAIEPHHMDAEILRLFELKILSKADATALQCVTKNASASAAMIAVSPFALLDMAIVLWRNFVMLKQVSRAYGIKLSYWGRISLVRQIFKTMLYAGASEIVADAGNYALGAGVTGKLSTRVAQGLGAGVLTTRIGVKAMHACRPLPWIENKPPGLSKLASQLLQDLKKVTS